MGVKLARHIFQAHGFVWGPVQYLLPTAVYFAAGCSQRGSPPRLHPIERSPAAGVIVRTISPGGLAGESGAALIEVDLVKAGVRTVVAGEDVRLEGGRIFSTARTVREWCQSRNAFAGVNGGFFGLTSGGRKEVIGLLALDELVLSTGRLVRSTRNPAKRFVRSVLGFDGDGMPHIGWAVGQRGRASMLTEYLQPLNSVRQRFWTVDSAVGCGPRLIESGRVKITDSEERLMSPPPLPRTFAAYSVAASARPARLVLGIADSMTFSDVAAFLDRYFRIRFNTPCSDAMCLDGGASSQLAYRDGENVVDLSAFGIAVPTAILVLPRRTH